MARFSCIAWESGQCELYFSLYIYKSGLCLTGKRFRCGSFPYLFGHFARSFFSGPLSVSHDQRLPVNLSRSFSQPTDRSIDRSYRIDHLFFLSLALSDFSIDYSARGFRSLFSTPFFFTRSFSRAEALSMEQQEICVRHDRILQLSFVLFCFCAFGYSLSHGNRTQHNGRIVQPADFPAPLYAVRLLVVRRLASRCFERVHPFNFVHFASGGAANANLPSSCLTRLILGMTVLSGEHLKYGRLNVTVLGAALAKATPMRLLFNSLRGITRISEAKGIGNNFVMGFPRNPWNVRFKDLRKVYSTRETSAWKFAWFCETIARGVPPVQ